MPNYAMKVTKTLYLGVAAKNELAAQVDCKQILQELGSELEYEISIECEGEIPNSDLCDEHGNNLNPEKAWEDFEK